jgi:predicted chitinase
MDSVPGLKDEKQFWYFHPLEVIRWFRRCKWIGTQEVGQLIPAHAWLPQTGAIRAPLSTASTTLSENDVVQRISPYLTALNKTIRKYSLDSSSDRLAMFLAQTYIETDRWRTIKEGGRGAPNPRIPLAQYYAAFFGRGIIQMTWANEYEAYGNFSAFPDNTGAYAGEPRITQTSLHYWDDPRDPHNHNHIILHPKRWAPRYNPEILLTDPLIACDSGGFFWVWKHHDRVRNISRVADWGFTTQAINRVNILVNGGGNGYYERFDFSWYTRYIFTDWVPPSVHVDVRTPRHNVVVRVDLSRPE